ncbi:MAG: hypothetical protein WDN67_03660 [Candidatus Moraniibacteriota bacterium]
MENKMLWIVGGVTLLLIAGLVGWGIFEQKKTAQEAASAGPDANIIYYWGAECPHCKAINEFIEQNDIASKVQFTKKEVWHNRQNSQEMAERAKTCGIDPNNIGVPFVFDAEAKTCTMGEPDTRKFFAERAGISSDEATPAQ